VTCALGTFGWLFASLGIGTSCDEALECTGSCNPCAPAHAWVVAGGIGQWLLVAAAAACLGIGLLHPGFRRVATAAAGALVLLAAGWFAASMAIAIHNEPHAAKPSLSRDGPTCRTDPGRPCAKALPLPEPIHPPPTDICLPLARPVTQSERLK
jgi:hypothetical protein